MWLFFIIPSLTVRKKYLIKKNWVNCLAHPQQKSNKIVKENNTGDVETAEWLDLETDCLELSAICCPRKYFRYTQRPKVIKSEAHSSLMASQVTFAMSLSFS